MYQRPIWCQRLNGGTLECNRAKDGCITWSTSQSLTSCCFADLCRARSHKTVSLGPQKISQALLPQISSSQQKDMAMKRLPWQITSDVGWSFWTWRITLMNNDCEQRGTDFSMCWRRHTVNKKHSNQCIVSIWLDLFVKPVRPAWMSQRLRATAVMYGVKLDEMFELY